MGNQVILVIQVDFTLSPLSQASLALNLIRTDERYVLHALYVKLTTKKGDYLIGSEPILQDHDS